MDLYADFTGSNWNNTYYIDAASLGGSYIRMRVVLTFDATPFGKAPGCGSDGFNCDYSKIDADLDLRVYNDLGGIAGSSTTYDSTWEAIDFAIDPARIFHTVVTKNVVNAYSTYFGLAWYGYN